MAQPPRPIPTFDPLLGVSDPEGHPIIPRLVSCASAIFCPIGEDDRLKDPLSSSSLTKLDCLQKQLDALNTHSVKDRENFLALAVRERERIFQEGRRFQALEELQGGQVKPDVPLGLTSQELGIMVANMEAPARPGIPNTEKIPPPNLDSSNARSLRERQAYEQMRSVAHFSQMAAHREAEINRRRESLEADIKKEQLRQDQERRVN
ncbi:hypothetical protein FVEG_04907 [Fusarium verticillioides 7600]|uniref:Uncharacterized protein n=2 Tax=Fusarium TaxID=5506 RepID=W7M7K8_GIBM7|nr:hypothetical protein FVEG_04907 [Fusarium verticillioides 7600]XP_044680254.1 hypothetical protein J7337_006938 [Fusarium musae]RBQ68831.1 hypothetical protein FVER14953_04907 [Fusarium verticillioides]EWG43439.1 hypothetical protein FVEG_04907 [Fusarium verticillioides 7600]KAG9501254.1 hypothetical protein J7337_006938 [Fusarium musae]RBR02435.1 hypothetical protein FVER53263_04907 [Fusarium verticillioides]RBR06415.1 hypothetical protein FVER53590_04907 [Fusarium verticillioides]